jgi:mono/diheme cytochrome c family protein
MRWLIVSFAVLLLFVGAIGDQQVAVHQVPIKKTSWTSGQEMYQEYCAVCHGKDGNGDGPAAPALKVPPADLTTLAKRNGGKFPYDHFAVVLRFGNPTPAHGSKDMPVWGPLFWSLPDHSEAIIHQRISNLAGYVASLQAK